MQRRLFITKTLTGLLLPLLPGAMMGAPTLSANSLQVVPVAVRNDLSPLMAQLGTLEQLQLDYTYSPGHTSLADLASLVREDFNRLAGAANLPVPLDTDALFADGPSAQFGSFGGSFPLGEVVVRCRVMARVGLPDAPPQRRSQLLGTLGVVAINNNTLTHLDLTGQVLQQGAFLTHQTA